MIYTCTLNPSLDYYMEMTQAIDPNKTNRSQLEYYEAGGKGINVSIVLSNLMIPSRAFGFLGGFTKDFYINLLERHEYLQPSFTYIDGHTRINVKASSSECKLDLNGSGPYITDANMENLKLKVDRLDENDIFVFSGSTLDYLLPAAEELIALCSANGVRVVLDTSPALIERCLKYNPFLICPKEEDLEMIVKGTMDHDKKVIEGAKQCVKLGAQHVVVYRHGKEAIMATEEGVYIAKKRATGESSADTVGSQDAMVAGFVMSSLRTSKSLECFRYANCCKEATIFAKNLEIRDRINEIYNQLEIEEIKL